MTATTSPSTRTPTLLELSRAECLRLLAGHRFGRVAVQGAAGYPLLRPVNYAFDPRTQSVVFRTAPGSKLHALLRSAGAVFEIDGMDPMQRTGWSVVVRGVVEEVTDRGERGRLRQLGVESWDSGEKDHWMLIRAGTVTGRRLEASAGAAVRRSPTLGRRQRDASNPVRVVIAGGGVAALETALALRAMAPEVVQTTLLAPDPEFNYRPMRVNEPFSYRTAQSFPLADIARDIDAELVVDRFKWLDSPAHVVQPRAGRCFAMTRSCSPWARACAPLSVTR